MAVSKSTKTSWRHRIGVLLGSSGLTVLCFLVLPILQAIAKSDDDTVRLTDVDTYIPPPDEPPPPEPEPEPEPDEKPPELQEQMAPLDLSQLELALNPSLGGGYLAGDFGVNLDNLAGGGGASAEDMFGGLEVDQKPKVIYRHAPNLSPELRRKDATVVVVFYVTVDGKVKDPEVYRSSDPAFERPALEAIKKWRFEPAKRRNEPVPDRMRLPMRFKRSR